MLFCNTFTKYTVNFWSSTCNSDYY